MFVSYCSWHLCRNPSTRHEYPRTGLHYTVSVFTAGLGILKEQPSPKGGIFDRALGAAKTFPLIHTSSPPDQCPLQAGRFSEADDPVPPVVPFRWKPHRTDRETSPLPGAIAAQVSTCGDGVPKSAQLATCRGDFTSITTPSRVEMTRHSDRKIGTSRAGERGTALRIRKPGEFSRPPKSEA